MAYTYNRTAASTVKMTNPEKSEINADLRAAGFDGNGRFRTVGHAHSAAGKVLEKNGYEFADMLDSYRVKDDAKALSLDIRKSDPEDSFSPVDVANTALHFSYTKLDDDRVEVVAYLG